jgi:thiol-disulfide isomerase/thioredoxin
MKKYISAIVFIVVVALIIGGIAWSASGPGQYDTFATCIKNSGATFWGAWWCPHCKEQKALFGKSVANLPYHECSSPDGANQLGDCKAAGIESYPTWDFKDVTNPATTTRKTGSLSLEDLAKFTGCPLAKDSK